MTSRTTLDSWSYLESLGHRVIVAQGGAEALRRVGFAQPDLILLDAMMPDMDGFEVCRQLQARGSVADIPVIFMTALKQIETKLSAFALGAVGLPDQTAASR